MLNFLLLILISKSLCDDPEADFGPKYDEMNPKLPSSGKKGKLQKGRIVGGEDCMEGNDFMVSLQAERNHVCGGTLVHPRWVLTAAHCNVPFLVAVIDMKILDSRTGQKKDIETFVPHPSYDQLSYDIALVRLKELVSDITPVQLPIGILPEHTIRHYHNCILVGWGVLQQSSYQASNILQCVKVKTMSIRECEKRYKKHLVESICTFSYGKDACQGDSGGPLLCDGTQIGVISWGKGCADSYYPGVHTAVDQNIRWIFKIINGEPRLKNCGKMISCIGLLIIVFLII